MRKAGSLAAGIVLGLVGVAACSGAPSDGVDVDVKMESAPRIIGGSPSTTAQDSTVFIAMQEGFCTGSLITPNLVLTARHCVSQMAGNDDCQHFTTDDSPSSMAVILGADASQSENPTPAAYGIKVFHETNNSGCSYDIALLQLDHDLTGAAIAPVRFTKATTSDVGSAVGYGDGDDHGNMTNGRYQRGGIAVTAVGPATYTYTTKKGSTIHVTVPPGELLTGESTCFGDSGGPLYDSAGYVIGVTSRGVDDYCVDRPSLWSDVYSHAKLIHDASVTAGHPLTINSATPDAGSSGSSGSSGTSGTSGGAAAPAADLPGKGGTSDHAANDAPPASPPETTVTTTSGCAAAPSSSGRHDLAVFAVGAIAAALIRRRRRRGR